MRPVTFLLLFALLQFGSADAQARKVDSLTSVLKQSIVRDTNRVNTINTLAPLLVRTNPDSAILLADQAISIATEKKYGRGLGNAVSTKCSAFMVKGLHDDAISECKKHMDQVLSFGYSKGYCLLYNRIAYSNIYAGRPLDAIPIFRESAAACEKYEQYNILSDTYRGMGMAYTDIGDHNKATESLVLAIQAGEKGADSKQVAYAYITLGNSQFNQHDNAAALKSYRHSLSMLDTLRDNYGRAGCYICIGNIYLDQRNLDSALVNFQKCLDIRIAMGNDPAGVAQVKENIGQVLREQGLPEKALVLFSEGLAFFQEANHQEGIAGSYSNLGSAYFDLGNYTEAEKSFLSSIEVARRLRLNNYLQEGYSGLSKVYYETGRYKEAAEYKDSLITITDIIVGEKHSTESKEIEARFRNQQNEEEILHLQETNQQHEALGVKQKQIITAVSVGLLLAVVLMFFVVRANAQRKKINAKLSEQNILIAEKNKDITDSITYARRIQRGILPDRNILFSNTSEAFIYYNPRDIVSGDFYWLRKEGSRLYVAAADCTGHGVPGALVSVIGVNLLEQILSANKKIETGALLDQLHEMMHAALHKDSADQGASDGMDIGLICIDTQQQVVEFSGASRPAYHFNGTELVQLKGDRFSIGGVKELDSDLRFATQRFNLRAGDIYYLFTDGFADQFGGPNGKKLMSKNFFDLVSKGVSKNMTQQEALLNESFLAWKGNLDQVDDVLVVGVKI
jgi:serine phosphatase RsbU (regulator of sigma subunit)/Tfp pilus assembly protein PilF